jgi:hypothetical protein
MHTCQALAARQQRCSVTSLTLKWNNVEQPRGSAALEHLDERA